MEHVSTPSSPPASSADEGAVRRSLDAFLAQREDRLVRLRRRLHATPEASGREVATTALVAELLRDRGGAPRVMDGGTGVVLDVDLGAPADRFVALRAELDCVEVADDKQVPYASTRPGLCHACGHDAHSTMLAGACTALLEHADALRGRGFHRNVRAIFQPAEETSEGARSMMNQGAIDGVEAILALHVEPFLDAGTFGLRKGALTAACKSFRVAIRGRSGHSARPFEATDPIPAAAEVVGLLYQLCPRSMDSRYPLALTVGSIQAGSAPNAIPDGATILGTLRTARTRDMELVQRRMEAVVRGVAEATGCEISLDILHSCPPTDNDPMLIDLAASLVASRFGADAVAWLDVPSLGGEDFAFYEELIPGAMIRLGAGLRDGRPRRPLHSSLFDIDETALGHGARFLVHAALDAAREPDLGVA